jgi:hypothetical protein
MEGALSQEFFTWWVSKVGEGSDGKICFQFQQRHQFENRIGRDGAFAFFGQGQGAAFSANQLGEAFLADAQALPEGSGNFHCLKVVTGLSFKNKMVARMQQEGVKQFFLLQGRLLQIIGWVRIIYTTSEFPSKSAFFEVTDLFLFDAQKGTQKRRWRPKVHAGG